MRIEDQFGVQIPNEEAADYGLPFSGGDAVIEWASRTFRSPLTRPENEVARAEARAIRMWFEGAATPIQITDNDWIEIKRLRDHFLSR